MPVINRWRFLGERFADEKFRERRERLKLAIDDEFDVRQFAASMTGTTE